MLELVREDRTLDTTGPAMSMSAGCYHALSRRFALHAQVRLEAINWRLTLEHWERPDGGSTTTETWIEDSGFARTASLGAVFRF